MTFETAYGTAGIQTSNSIHKSGSRFNRITGTALTICFVAFPRVGASHFWLENALTLQLHSSVNSSLQPRVFFSQMEKTDAA
ncbi:predicted protein [Brucella abortus bv. 3 str. Tulya]|nr:hypothetical protein [Brucella abortus]EEX83052.1 predicted protein [Brucella abortus bv. 3 str. Tulya]